MTETLIAADQHWALLAILFGATSLSIWLEQKYRWASKISGAIITLCIAVLLVNLRVIPASAPVFDDIVWGYAVPLAIPLLLLQTDIRRIHKETGRFLLIFLIGAAGTVAGTCLGTVLLRGASDSMSGVAAMMTGSYIGGGVNFTALADAFKVDSGIVASTTVADNLNMAVYFLVLLSIAGSAWFRKRYAHPHIDAVAPAAGAAPRRRRWRRSTGPARTSPSGTSPSTWPTPPSWSSCPGWWRTSSPA